jgi:transposase
MRKPVPVIHETAEALKQRLKQEPHPQRQQRLHALYLLASGQARYRHQVASLLGLDRNTIGVWLDRYAQGGLAMLLDLYVPQGKRPALTPDQLAQLQVAVAQATGFGSYGEIQQWIATTLGVSLSYNAVHKLVRYKLRAKLKVPRPTHIKKG